MASTRGNTDWHCPKCSNWVFATKVACKCGQVRDNPPMKAGDWVCPGCRGVVFASKSECGKCHTSKPRGNAPQQQPQQQQQSSPMQKPGDWYCPGCNGLVFASKDRCRCGTYKPGTSPNLYVNSVNPPLTNSTNPFSTFVNTDVNYNINVQYPSTNPFGGPANLGQSVGGVNNYSNNNTNNANMSGGGVVKRGDWRCSACNENNFASRQSCFKCRAVRPGANTGNANMVQQQAPQVQPAKFAGDWNCNCGASNFGSRNVCYKCATPRPDLNASNSDAKEDEGLCVICICEPSSHVIQDCGHLCLCEGCANNGRVNTCPMCRAPVRAIMKVYKA